MTRIEELDQQVMGLQVELLTTKEKLQLALEDKAGLLEWNEQAKQQNAQLQAKCEEMRSVLEYAGSHEHDGFDESASHYNQGCSVCQKIDKALSTTPSTDFIHKEQVRPIVEALNTCSYDSTHGCGDFQEHFYFNRLKVNKALQLARELGLATE